MLKDIEKKSAEKIGQKSFPIEKLILICCLRKIRRQALGKDIPHKDIDLYRFVLEPLAEIAPDLIHPKHQEKISEIWKRS